MFTPATIRYIQNNDSNRFVRLDDFTLDNFGRPASHESVTFTMKEYGNAMTYMLGNPDVAAMATKKIEESYKDFIDGLVENAKYLGIRQEDNPIRFMPVADKHQRYGQVGWYVMLGSPQIDFFKKFFECKRAHEPTTWRGCWHVARMILRRRLRELRYIIKHHHREDVW